MGLYIHLMPSLPDDVDYTKALPKLSSTEPLEILDPKTGFLNHEGWSKIPNKWLYNHEMNNAYVPFFTRHKFWNWFYVISGDYLVTMAHTNGGLVMAAHINIQDVSRKDSPIVETIVKEFFQDSIAIDENKNGGGMYSTISHDQMNMTFFRRPEGTTTDIDISVHSDQGLIEGKLEADSQGYEGFAHVSSNPNDPTKHTYMSKHQQKFVGSINLGGKEIITCTKKSPCQGFEDNGGGYLPYPTHWVQALTTFKSKGRDIHISIGSGDDNPHSSFDHIFIDGKLHKLDPHIATKVSDTHWKWEKNPVTNKYDISVEMEFRVQKSHIIQGHYVIYDVDSRDDYGYFSGTITTPNGKIPFNNTMGIIDEIYARW
ncbi:unnamed protein product [Moneuplotes crassus]|uniref:Uncharacterized protein n=1 Tax=Euplotes crassus TaxID=5936 RepID=A0AAD1XG76_EUPCR|nr:unnamed protein product [Moneuplotes crassus]